MKTFSIYLIVVSIIIPLCSCEDDDNATRPIPFRLEFFSLGGPIEGDTSCGEPPIIMVGQQGEGVDDPLLGNYIFISQFCNNVVTGEYGDHSFFAEEGRSSSFAYFQTENGDRLNIGPIKGQIIPSTKEGYDLMFQDSFEIVGGSGRFEGATGSGMTDSFIKLQTGRTDHVWTGTIVLK
ncbi:hypothetical protein [Allomuricauda sp. SCSIO 65647]|uniref:hypothetical protein n=1 Tax=Allomuricauda sp. SCSIO 65647 TaxID=2908843 RepID=UPI001F393D21|nr:hypothetical protein [Muricauda sp. SCSIO 65647]UJH67865.1 hypothetical protein L0P89_01270 [Muricauda sp. SCSIO 65647]